ncbi:hypothetical protein SY83_17670 [Paenibacillus swuensis]|uniref:Cytoplasmic protein n=1 Tax=Paenibacillus swuensis TaxID=1178515 RepID=A0A172TLM3_9BACL|nr:DUF1697 domain-containing protein [Paenibacillus swuensis]ANE47814.1 hypothetical protein SY83_17670 [Paenibacillus swuensis]
MITYIALLRGINVSGQKMIKMDRLKELFNQLGYLEARTYIQSGNVIFRSESKDTIKISQQIVLGIKNTFDFDVPVVVRTVEDFQRVLEGNPFAENILEEEGKIYVSFLSDPPVPEHIEILQSFRSPVDEYIVKEKEVYIFCRESYGKSLFSNNFLEKKLKVFATTRNWKTVNSLYEIANEE